MCQLSSPKKGTMKPILLFLAFSIAALNAAPVRATVGPTDAPLAQTATRSSGILVASNEFRDDGAIVKDGHVIGEVRKDGTIVKDGHLVGEVRQDGTIVKDGHLVGEVRGDGTVLKEGHVLSDVKGKEAAITYFFFDN